MSEPYPKTAALVVSGVVARSSDLAAAARSAGHLVIEVVFLTQDEGPWHSQTMPGAANGCSLTSVDGVGHARMVTDQNGVFFGAQIDLLLRSHSANQLRLVGDFPAPFTEAVQGLGVARGHEVVLDGEIDPKTVAAFIRSLGGGGETPLSRPFDLARRIAPGRAALVLIDVQNDFCAPDGATGRSGQPMNMIRDAAERIKTLLAAAREAGLFIVHVKAEYGALFRHVGSPYRFPASGGREPAVWTESAADLSGQERFAGDNVEVCLSGSWGGAFIDGIDPRPGEAVVAKHRFSAFADTGLDLMLRARGIETVVVAGVTTNCCVESTSREAVMRDFYLVVVEDCVAVKDHLKDLHDATLESLGLYFGLVRPSSVIIEAWRQGQDRSGPTSDRPVVRAGERN